MKTSADCGREQAILDVNGGKILTDADFDELFEEHTFEYATAYIDMYEELTREDY